MPKSTSHSPLKIGFLIVVVAYFLFTFHAMFTLSWIGEWESFNEPLRSIVFVEDIFGTIGIASRLIASALALAGVILYTAKRGLSKATMMKLFRLVLIGEAVYWLGLLAAGVLSLTSTLGFTIWRVDGHISTLPVPTDLLIYEIPLLIESVVIPIVLFKLAYQSNMNKPVKGAIKWALIVGAVYVLVFWLTNTAMWVSTVMRQGSRYLLLFPENLFSLALTAVGLLVLTIFTVVFAKKSLEAGSVEKLDIQKIGAIVAVLGLVFLWNYLTWIFFGRDEIWSNWYVWFLGHNSNLWLLSLPLVGLPLVVKNLKNTVWLVFEGVGAIFASLFLAAYLGGIPTTVVYHSEPVFRVPLAVFGALFLVIALVVLVLSMRSKKGLLF